MSFAQYPAPFALVALRSRLEESEADGLRGKLDEVGINMVDLMMWLVIATLLLAAALQGIGYYQKASWTYQARSDVSSVRTYMEAQYTMNSNAYPFFTTAPADIKLTGGNKAATVSDSKGGWKATIKSASLAQISGTEPSLFNFASVDDPTTTTVDESTNNIKAGTTAYVTPA